MNLRLAKAVIALTLVATFLGCSPEVERAFKTGKWRLGDPSKAIAKKDRVTTLHINNQMTSLDDSQTLFKNAVRPTAADCTYDDSDYIIGSNDRLEITIRGLYESVAEAYMHRLVSDKGYIDLPQIDKSLKVEGLTEKQLVEAIKDAYREAEILKDPIIVLASVVERRQRIFSIMGSVRQPSNYELQRKDTTLLQALSMAGDVVDPTIEWIYIIRPAKVKKRDAQDAKEDAAIEQTVKALSKDPSVIFAREYAKAALTDKSRVPRRFIRRRGVRRQLSSKPFAVFNRTATDEDMPIKPVSSKNRSLNSDYWDCVDGVWVLKKAKQSTDKQGIVYNTPKRTDKFEQNQTYEIFSQQATESVSEKLIKNFRKKKKDPFGWRRKTEAGQARIIAINYKKLAQGDSRMNVVIREGDIIQVPLVEPAEFYVMGEVARPGVYSMTGRQITVKMAVTAAGNLGALAWPENSVLIRRVGSNKEQFIPINIENIIRGDDPDLFLKKDDVIAVGTEWRTTFMAVLRNAFRMTYGFGFVYDRNFADPIIGSVDSRRFTRW